MLLHCYNSIRNFLRDVLLTPLISFQGGEEAEETAQETAKRNGEHFPTFLLNTDQ
jgi:hypothetical protein